MFYSNKTETYTVSPFTTDHIYGTEGNIFEGVHIVAVEVSIFSIKCLLRKIPERKFCRMTKCRFRKTVMYTKVVFVFRDLF